MAVGSRHYKFGGFPVHPKQLHGSKGYRLSGLPT
ncbi:hypothetical protein CCACVL1_20530, partial [Corchorus capsularis]